MCMYLCAGVCVCHTVCSNQCILKPIYVNSARLCRGKSAQIT